MGCVMSAEEVLEERRNGQVEGQLKQDRVVRRNEVRILLLGAGESGKSTVLKQMKLIHEGGYSREERRSFKPVIFDNTIQSMRALLEAMTSLNIAFDDQRALNHVQVVANYERTESDDLPPGVSRAISVLWHDPGVQRCFQRSREYQLNDSAKYYFDSIDRIAASDYTPNDQDVLRSRLKTTGITETTFFIGDLTYRMIDVGGQRTERKKWIHCFEDVTAILFLAALSEYDQFLFEDETINRIEEALTLFGSICQSQWFADTSIILFFNKTDVFEEKLLISPLQECFADYKGGSDLTAACAYIANKFLSVNQHMQKQIYAHFTCATDTLQVHRVLVAVNDIIMQENLKLMNVL